MIKKGLLLLLSLFIYGLMINAQQIDLNVCINKRIKKLGVLKDSYFYKGYVIKNNDTLQCRIYLRKGKVSDDSYFFVITKNDKDSLVYYSANDIDGYYVNNIYFKKYTSKGETIFIRLVKKGAINLYEKSATPNNNEFTYYLFMPDGKVYSIEPFTENILDIYREGHLANRPEGLLSTKTKKLDEKFKNSFSKILKDCPSAVYLISSEFYGINDIEPIVELYNKCKNENR